MLDRFDQVRITRTDNTCLEGYLVDVTDQVGTLHSLDAKTAIDLTDATIEVLYPGTHPVALPHLTPTNQASTPYTCSECSKPLSFSHAFFHDGLVYCGNDLPQYDKHQQW